MSSKGTVFLTSDQEHCYEETNERDNGEFRIYLEIDNNNITEILYDVDNTLIIGIKGDSDIANYIRKIR
jgi:hypothetical protein